MSVTVLVNGVPYPLTFRNYTAAEKATALEGGAVVVDWTTDTGEYHSSPNSMSAELVENVWDPFTTITYRILRAELYIDAVSEITFWAKLESGATRMLTFMGEEYPSGGVFLASVINDASETVDSVPLGGWVDWSECTLDVATPGHYFLDVMYVDGPVALLGNPDWPAVPEGETATDTAWIDDWAIDPSMTLPVNLQWTTHAPGPVKAYPPVVDAEWTPLATVHFIGDIISIPAATPAWTANSPSSIKAVAQLQTEYTVKTLSEALASREIIHFNAYDGWEQSDTIYVSHAPTVYTHFVNGDSAGHRNFHFYYRGTYPAYLDFYMRRVCAVDNPAFDYVRVWYQGSPGYVDVRNIEPYEIQDGLSLSSGTWTHFRFQLPDVDITYPDFLVSVYNNAVTSESDEFYLLISGISIIQTATKPPTSLAMTPVNPSYIWAIPADEANKAVAVYLCTLTGAEDSTTDVVLPVSSIEARLRSGDPSYLSVVVPDVPLHQAFVTARENGQLVVKRGYRLSTGITQYEEIARADLDSVQLAHGVKSSSIVLSGHKTVTATSPKDRTLTGVSYRGVSAEGKRTFYCDVDLFLRAGDTAVVGDESMVVGLIYYSINASNQQMQVTEVEEE